MEVQIKTIPRFLYSIQLRLVRNSPVTAWDMHINLQQTSRNQKCGKTSLKASNLAARWWKGSEALFVKEENVSDNKRVGSIRRFFLYVLLQMTSTPYSQVPSSKKGAKVQAWKSWHSISWKRMFQIQLFNPYSFLNLSINWIHLFLYLKAYLGCRYAKVGAFQAWWLEQYTAITGLSIWTKGVLYHFL